MNKAELKKKILLEAFTWSENMVSHEDFLNRVLSIICSETVDAVKGCEYPCGALQGEPAIEIDEVIKAITKRLTGEEK